MWMLLLALACDEQVAEPHAQAHSSGAHPEPKADPHGAHGAHEAQASHERQGAPGLTLALNDGARWQLDANTRAVLGESRASLKGAQPNSVEEAHALAASLEEQQGRLIRGCTMSGSSHDELHHFLEVWIPGVKALSQAKTLDESRAQIGLLQEHVQVFDQHFE